MALLALLIAAPFIYDYVHGVIIRKRIEKVFDSGGTYFEVVRILGKPIASGEVSAIKNDRRAKDFPELEATGQNLRYGYWIHEGFPRFSTFVVFEVPSMIISHQRIIVRF